MSHFPSGPHLRRATLHLGAVAACALLAATSLHAQERASGLRSAFPETSATAASPLDRRAGQQREPLERRQAEPLAPDNAPLPSYRPASQGAIPEAAVDPRIEELLGARPRASGATDTASRPATRRPAAQPAPAPRPTATAQSQSQAQAQAQEPLTTGSLARPDALPAPDDAPRPPNASVQGLDSADLERNVRASPDAERTGAIETRRGAPDDSPFAPAGIRAGSFVLRPALEQGLEWSSNAAATAGGSSDLLSSTTLRLGGASDWSRHALTFDAYGTWRQSLRGTGFSEIAAGANAALRLDLAEGFVSTTSASYLRRPESASVGAPVIGRPLRETSRAATALEKTLGPVLLSARVSAERNAYWNAVLAAGGVASQADLNNTLYAFTLRGGYEVSPAMRPFVEAEIGRRAYDSRLDAAGFARSSRRYGARAGLSFDMGEKFNGEVAAGWLGETPDDGRLAAISAGTLDATVAWSPIRGTQVDLNLSTNVEADAAAGSALVHGASLGATHEFGRRLTGTALLSAELRRYAGTADSDTRLGASASLTWWLNRNAGITGRASYEQQDSTLPDRSYGATGIYVGFTLQR